MTVSNRLDQTLANARADGKSVLSPYMTVGFPDFETSIDIAEAILRNGGDLMEIGVPFSDPLADGPTVQRTSFQALQNGITVRKCLDAIRQLRSRGIEAPLMMMGYYNPFFHYGIEDFVRYAADAGVDGLIVPDLPPEESEQFEALCEANNVHQIHFVSLTTTDERIEYIAKHASGFIYCVAVLGVTGARTDMRADISDLVKRVRKYTDVPVIQGFGVSTKEHVDSIATYADGAIVASAMFDTIEDAPADQKVQAAVDFVKRLKGLP
jgi:tryptophan synthase alpha chain